MTVKVTKPAINVREELADLRKPTGIAGEAMLRAETPQEQFNLIGAGRRNIFINGGFTVSQRGDYTSATATSSEAYALDRWKNYLNTVSATFQHTTVTINGVTKRALKMAATSSGTGFFGPVQQVELSAFQVGVDLTMSGYVRTNHPNVYFRHDYVAGVTGIQSPNRISNDGSWNYVTWTLNTAGTTLAPIFQVLAYDNGSVSVTSGDYIEIADMQLELGKVATPFEHRSYGEELALCQRYCWVQERGTTGSSDNAYLGHGRAVSTSNAEVIIRNPVVMRGAPEVTLSGNLVANNGASRIGSSYSVQEPSTHSFQVTGGGMSSLVVNECVRIYLKDDGDTITVDAEL
jgi:hypothetical protein